MKNIVSFSGGKDSTAMLLKMIEENIRIDRVILVDTTKEFPEMYDHIKKVKRYIEHHDLTVETIKIDFDYWFYTHKLIKGKNKGKSGYGWPSFKFRWCSGLKMDAFRASIGGIYDPCRRNQRSLKLIDGNMIHLGYSVEEANRVKQGKNRNEVYPLIDWKMTGEDCIQYCYDKGFDWGGLYEKMSRVSCWCCPLSRIGELKILHDEYPLLWRELKEMDCKSYRRFRCDYTVDELTDKFAISSRSACGKILVKPFSCIDINTTAKR